LVALQHFFETVIAEVFTRPEPRQHALAYIKTLLSDENHIPNLQRQRLLYDARWDVEALGRNIRQYLAAEFSNPNAVIVLDEISFAKKGDKSVGVSPQWDSHDQRLKNCQMGVFLGYMVGDYEMIWDRSLYMPREWIDDQERRNTAKVPPDVIYRPKPQLAHQMLQTLWAENIPMQWVVAELNFGNMAYLRDSIHEHGKYYLLEITSQTQVFPEDTNQPTTAKELAAHTTRHLESPDFNWAYQRVRLETDHVGMQWLIIRHSSPPRYYLSNAPAHLLHSIGQLLSANQLFRQCVLKTHQVAGLGDYEVRSWDSWHRHMTLSMLAYAWWAINQNDFDTEEYSDSDFFML
jgi:SRSO17 transposase